MRTGMVRRTARVLAVAGAVALVTAAPGAAQAAAPATTRYDGDATALRVEGLHLTLFPNGLDGAPEQLKPLVDALKQVQRQAPEQLQRDNLTLAMPDQVIGHAEFPGVDTQGAIPPNPLLTADILPAKSVKAPNGNLVSKAGVADLSLGGGVLSAGLITTKCVGTGDRMSVDVSQLRLRSNQDIVDTEVTLKPGTAVPIEGLGTITFNQQDTDGRTYAEGTNVVLDLDSDLSLAALARVFDVTAPAVEDALKQVLVDLGQTEVGPDHDKPLAPALNRANVDKLQGQQLYDGVDTILDEADKNAPEPLSTALNNVAHLGGTITIANAACAQDTVPVSSPQQPQQAAPAQPVADSPSEPPLADTGSPAGMLAAGLGGILALAGAGMALMRLRRHGG